MIETTVVFIRTGPAGRTPLYATAGSAGCDLFAASPLVLRPGESRVQPLDLVMALEPGVEAQIRPRSGLSLRTELRVPNAPGTIDSDYRCEVGVLLQNTFTLSRLAEQIIVRPQLAQDLAKSCRRVTLAEYLWHDSGDPEALAGTSGVTSDLSAKSADAGDATAAAANLTENLPELASQMIYLDSRGNPWGTIYIEAGERIAQMIFSRCLQAEFREHPAPEGVGQDRGGGFGSTGGFATTI